MDWPARRNPRGSLLYAGGRGDFIEKYIEALHHWRQAGWNVTTFDWRGQGASRGDIEGGNLGDFEAWIADLAALSSNVRADSAGPHIVIGHSMGGHLVLRALAERRVAPDAAVLTAPMIEVNSAPLPGLAGAPLAELMCATGMSDVRMWTNPPRGTPWWDRRQASLTKSPQRYADELYWWGREPGFQIGPPSWGWMRAAYRSASEWFTPARLAKVAEPVLIVGTDRDRLVSPSAIRRVAGLLPRGELFMFPTAAHEILREVDEVRLDALARIDAFLAREVGQRAAAR